MDMLSFLDLSHTAYVNRLQDKFLEEKAMGGIESANAAHGKEETSIDESAYSATKPTPWMTKPGGQKTGKLDGYCFLFAKTGKCRFGTSCKFKHINKSDLPAHDEVAHAIQWANAIANTHLKQTAKLARVSTSRNAWKKKFSKPRPKPEPTGPPGDHNTTYEATVKNTASAYSSLEHKQENSTVDTDYDSDSLLSSDPDTDGSEQQE